MNWKVKEKQPKPVKKQKDEKPKPNIGDKEDRIRFALFPTKVLDKWIWLERYISIYEYKSIPVIRMEETADFLLWQEYKRYWDTWTGWCFSDRKFFKHNN